MFALDELIKGWIMKGNNKKRKDNENDTLFSLLKFVISLYSSDSFHKLLKITQIDCCVSIRQGRCA